MAVFESGALSKVQSAGRVIPYCFEFSLSSLPQPLGDFQGCVADRDGTLNLIRSINATSKTLHPDHVEIIFDKCWNEFKSALDGATRELQDFLFFFGRPDTDGAVYPAVFADLYLEPIQCIKKAAGDEKVELGRIKPVEENSKYKLPKGIRQLVPYQEIAPVYKLSRAFERFGRRVEIIVESEISNRRPNAGCLSMGLGFNKLTWELGENSGMYRVYFEGDYIEEPNPDGPADSRVFLTDDFEIRPDGIEEPTKPREEVQRLKIEGAEWGLLARILVNKGTRSVPYIVCAGHTADGTAAACDYLADNWSTLCRGKDRGDLETKHMAIIVTHPKGQLQGPYLPLGPFFRTPNSPKRGIWR
jgi:hypothetical protein